MRELLKFQENRQLIYQKERKNILSLHLNIFEIILHANPREYKLLYKDHINIFHPKLCLDLF